MTIQFIAFGYFLFGKNEQSFQPSYDLKLLDSQLHSAESHGLLFIVAGSII